MIEKLLIMYLFGGMFLLGTFFVVGGCNSLTRFVGVLSFTVGVLGGLIILAPYI